MSSVSYLNFKIDKPLLEKESYILHRNVTAINTRPAPFANLVEFSFLIPIFV